MKVSKNLSNKSLLSIIILITFIKTIFFISIKNEFFSIGLGAGDDSDYYNGYAVGYFDEAVNLWAVMLRYLNDIGLYSRTIISYILFFISLFLIPTLVNKLAGLTFKGNQKNYLYIILLISTYPTIFFYTFDVYRDVFMVFSFLLGCLIVKKSLNNSNYISFLILFMFSLVIGVFLLGLRPYLGYAFLLALFLWKVKFTKKRLVFITVVYLSALFFINYLGYLEYLTEYRSSFEEVGGGSTLGLDFSNPVMFIPNFILSTLGQLFGLYITNPLAIILFLVETVPFFFMLLYVVKNINLADNFVRFLLIFFVAYGSVWLIANDNLGTAVRLRIYNYLVIYISFFYILRLKKLYSETSEVVSK